MPFINTLETNPGVAGENPVSDATASAGIDRGTLGISHRDLQQDPLTSHSSVDFVEEFLGSCSSSEDSAILEYQAFSNELIDLCDDTEDDVVEVGVSVPATSREDFSVSISQSSVGLSEVFTIIDLIDEGGGVESIFSRIQQHLRAQAMFLGQIGLLGTPNLIPSIQPKVLLGQLPIRRLSGITEAESLGACPICLEQYKPRMQVRTIPGCGHVVHKTCMDKWITKSHRNTCPLDNIPIQVSSSHVHQTEILRSPSVRRSRRTTRKSSSRGAEL